MHPTTFSQSSQDLHQVYLLEKDIHENLTHCYDTGGRQIKGWTNKFIWGDNKLILSSLKSGPLRREIEYAGGLKLIYIDPPFDVGADFSMEIEIGGETFQRSQTSSKKSPTAIPGAAALIPSSP